MFAPLKCKVHSVVGIDINWFGVTLIEMSIFNGMHRIEGVSKERLPPGALEGNTIKHRHVVSECIQQALEKGGIHSKQAVVAIPDLEVMTQVISIHTGLCDREMEALIQLELAQDGIFKNHDMYVDFQSIGPSVDKFAMQEVRVFASRRESVNERIAVVNRADLQVKVVDIESHAMQRSMQGLAKSLAIEKRAQGKPAPFVANLDLGVLETRLCVLQGENVIFTREEAFATQPLIAAFLKDQICDRDAFREHKTTLPSFMEGLLLQIKRMMQCFLSTSAHQSIEAILLSGELAQVPNLPSLIQTNLGIVTSRVNPLSVCCMNEKLDYQWLSDLLPSMMLAFGLALRCEG